MTTDRKPWLAVLQHVFTILPMLVGVAPGLAGQTASSRALADTLLVVIHVDELALAGVRFAFVEQVEQNPSFAPLQDVLEEWARKCVTGQEFHEGLASLYVETFTEAELRDLVAFYRSPTGQRMVMMQPSLLEKHAALGKQLALAHQDELVQMLQERINALSDPTVQQ